MPSKSLLELYKSGGHRMKNLIAIITIFMLVGGCATVTSSGVQRMGENIYTITVSMDGLKLAGSENSSKTRTKALKDANNYCSTKSGGYANILKEEISKSETATAILYFNCKQ